MTVQCSAFYRSSTNLNAKFKRGHRGHRAPRSVGSLSRRLQSLLGVWSEIAVRLSLEWKFGALKTEGKKKSLLSSNAPSSSSSSPLLLLTSRSSRGASTTTPPVHGTCRRWACPCTVRWTRAGRWHAPAPVSGPEGRHTFIKMKNCFFTGSLHTHYVL